MLKGPRRLIALEEGIRRRACIYWQLMAMILRYGLSMCAKFVVEVAYGNET
jgi:hypothetical protein